MSRTSIAQTTTNPPPPPPPLMQGGKGVAAGSKKAGPATCGFRLPKRRPNIQPGKLLKKLGLKLARATRLMASTRKQRSSCKVSSATLLRSRSCADPITDDSHRAQAIEDCIEFLNSSSLQRLNSVSSSSYSA